MGDLVTFVFAVGSHWLALMTGGAIAILITVWERRKGQIPWSRFVSICGIAVFVASFQAWKDEHNQVITARQTVDVLSQKKERSYPGDYISRVGGLAERLNVVLRSAPPGSWVWIGYVDNPSAVKLTEAIFKTVKLPGINIQANAAPEDDPEGSGLTLSVSNPDHPSKMDAAIIGAFRASGFSVKLEKKDPAPAYSAMVFGLYISYPPS